MTRYHVSYELYDRNGPFIQPDYESKDYYVEKEDIDGFRRWAIATVRKKSTQRMTCIVNLLAPRKHGIRGSVLDFGDMMIWQTEGPNQYRIDPATGKLKGRLRA